MKPVIAQAALAELQAAVDYYNVNVDGKLARAFLEEFERALWDVLGACEREGSLDSAIRKPAANDFARLRELCPLLETVGFNGQTSGKFAPQFAAEGYRTVVLPSTSPAHASMSLDAKLVAWGYLFPAELRRARVLERPSKKKAVT
nr:DNA-deoxyinosine glycosylase [uncultured Duganella sp.]